MPHFMRVGDKFEVFGKAHRIYDLKSDIIKAQRADDLEMVDFKINSLLQMDTFQFIGNKRQAAPPPVDPGLDALEKEVMEEITNNYNLIEPFALFYENLEMLEEKYPELLEGENRWDLNLTSLMKKRAVQLRSAGCLVSERKLWRLWKKYKHGGMKGLMDERGTGVTKRSDNNMIKIIHPRTEEVLQHIPCRLSKEQVEVMEHVISGFYLKPDSPTKEKALQKAEGECSRLNIPKVSKSTFYRILDSIDERYIVLFHEGKKAYDKKYRQLENRINEALGPLHIVQIDHTLMDINVIDDERTGVIGRPWLTVGIDEYSRMPWCIETGWEHPSAKVVARAIFQGVLPKNTKEKYRTENDWEVLGVPGIIYCDNGKEFHSIEFQRIVEQELKSELRYRPPGIPHFAGSVERIFGTINTQLIHQLPGTTKSNPGKIGDRDPQKEACITLSELRELVIKFLVDIYPFKEHKGLPKDCPLPAVYYEQGLEKMGLPRIIPTSEKENLLIRFLPETHRRIGREGIQINNIFYSSEKTRTLVGYSNQRVKTDPYDVSYIYLLHHESKEWLKIPARKPSSVILDGVTEYEWDCLQKLATEKGKKIIAGTQQNKRILELREQIRKQVESYKNKTRKARRQAVILKSKEEKFEDRKQVEMKDALAKLKEIKEKQIIDKNIASSFKKLETDKKVDVLNKSSCYKKL